MVELVINEELKIGNRIALINGGTRIVVFNNCEGSLVTGINLINKRNYRAINYWDFDTFNWDGGDMLIIRFATFEEIKRYNEFKKNCNIKNNEYNH